MSVNARVHRRLCRLTSVNAWACQPSCRFSIFLTDRSCLLMSVFNILEGQEQWQAQCCKQARSAANPCKGWSLHGVLVGARTHASTVSDPQSGTQKAHCRQHSLHNDRLAAAYPPPPDPPTSSRVIPPAAQPLSPPAKGPSEGEVSYCRFPARLGCQLFRQFDAKAI